MRVGTRDIVIFGSDGVFSSKAFVDGLARMKYDFDEKHVIEIGPKHGIHTMLIDAHGPSSITCVELPEKREETKGWINKIKSPISFVYEDLLRFKGGERKYDFVMFCGVLYHNNEQLKLLKRLHSISSDDALMMFESSTTRDESLMERNVIEVHWPKRYKNTKTVIFHPSKLACRSLLEIAGWEVLYSSDENPKIKMDYRVAFLCKKSDKKLVTYVDVDHSCIDEDDDE